MIDYIRDTCMYGILQVDSVFRMVLYIVCSALYQYYILQTMYGTICRLKSVKKHPHYRRKEMNGT